MHSFHIITFSYLFSFQLLSCLCQGKLDDSLIQPDDSARSFHYKGVALGGWLVLEPYITPSLFLAFNSSSNSSESDIPIDEYHFCQALGQDEAKKRLEHHWSTWFTENDFADMKSYGINMVRIPIGYWAFEKLPHDPFVKGAQAYLDRALEWAKKYDLKAWIDLHGAPGSQNGFDNSGFRDIGYPGWFNTTERINLTKRVLHKIFTKYGGHNISEEYKNTILGIEVINEPLQTPSKKLKDFYTQMYYDARKSQVINNTLIFHDGFRPIGYWDDFLRSNDKRNETLGNYNILIDHHHYQVFSSGSLELSIEETLQSIKDYAEPIRDELRHHPAVVGEWSAALTDCTPWVNGVGLGARYAGQKPYNGKKIGDCTKVIEWKHWSQERRKNYRKFVEMQLYEYTKNSNGWIFWCYKTEDTMEWDFKRLVENGLFPQPLNNYTYIVNGEDVTKKKPKKKSGASNLSVHHVLVLCCVFITIINL